MKPAYRPHVRYRALLYGANISHVFIEGPGTIDGSGAFWWQRSLDTRDSAQPWAPAGLLHIVGADRLSITGVTFKNSPKFAVRPQFSRHVKIHGVKVENPPDAPSTNGIVIDSCQTVEVSDCTVKTGNKEDAIVVKSGEDEYGVAANQPSRNIVIQRCTVLRGHAISLGSEMSGALCPLFSLQRSDAWPGECHPPSARLAEQETD